MPKPVDRTLAQRVLRADQVNWDYFAVRTELQEAVIYIAERSDAPEFDIALIYRLAPGAADAVIAAILRHFRKHGRRPRIRITEVSEPSDLAMRLRQAGLVETDDRYDYLTLPAVDWPPSDPAIVVEAATTADDADRFSAVQVTGFNIPPEHQDWDRALARRHVAAGRHTFYLASFNGETIGSARSIHLTGNLAGLSALATLPAARGLGVGTSLLRRMADDARDAGCTTLFGVVRSGSYAAGYYERIGWIPLVAARTFAVPE